MKWSEVRANDQVVRRLITTLAEANVTNPEFAAIKKILIEGVDGRFTKIEVEDTGL
jgi:hypothetical protein